MNRMIALCAVIVALLCCEDSQAAEYLIWADRWRISRCDFAPTPRVAFEYRGDLTVALTNRLTAVHLSYLLIVQLGSSK
jgi:hypothetical protein